MILAQGYLWAVCLSTSRLSAALLWIRDPWWAVSRGLSTLIHLLWFMVTSPVWGGSCQTCKVIPQTLLRSIRSDWAQKEFARGRCHFSWENNIEKYSRSRRQHKRNLLPGERTTYWAIITSQSLRHGLRKERQVSSFDEVKAVEKRQADLAWPHILHSYLIMQDGHI